MRFSSVDGKAIIATAELGIFVATLFSASFSISMHKLSFWNSSPLL